MIPKTGSFSNRRGNAGKTAVSCRKIRELAGSGSSIPVENIPLFFQWVPSEKGSHLDAIHREKKIEKFPTRKLLPRFKHFQCFLSVAAVLLCPARTKDTISYTAVILATETEIWTVILLK